MRDYSYIQIYIGHSSVVVFVKSTAIYTIYKL